MEDKTHTAFSNVELESTEAEQERFLGNVVMTIGATLFMVPSAQPVAIGIILLGLIISADANGLINDPFNLTRIGETSIDFVTSGVPYGKIFGILKKASTIGSTFIKFADKLDSIGGVLFDHEDLIGGSIKAGYTVFAETYLMNGSKTMPEAIVDGLMNSVPTKLFTKFELKVEIIGNKNNYGIN